MQNIPHAKITTYRIYHMQKYHMQKISHAKNITRKKYHMQKKIPMAISTVVLLVQSKVPMLFYLVSVMTMMLVNLRQW